jgi:hypothetical protein
MILGHFLSFSKVSKKKRAPVYPIGAIVEPFFWVRVEPTSCIRECGGLDWSRWEEEVYYIEKTLELRESGYRAEE